MEPRSIDRGSGLVASTPGYTEPLQWSRDRSIAEVSPSTPAKTAYRCFNGAAIDRSRKCLSEDIGVLLRRASMEPRSIDRGSSSFHSRSIDQLRASMEPRSIDRGSERSGPQRDRPHPASMEPRSIDRGSRVLRLWRLDRDRASMEPRSIDRGSTLNSIFRTVHDVLQWSRDRSIAEVTYCGNRRTESRCFNGAAIDRSRKSDVNACSRRVGSRFNGAAIDRSRKYHVVATPVAVTFVLQWSRDRSIDRGSSPYPNVF